MMGISTRLGAVCAITVLATTASFAQIKKTGNTYSFRMKYAKGQSLKYVIEITNSSASMATPGAGKMVITMPMSQTVNAVDGKGVADITVGLGPILMGEREVSKAQSQQVKVDSLGKSVGASGNMASNFTSLPPKSVKIGESWKSSIDLGAQAMGAKATGTYTFVSVKKVGGVEVAEIAMSLSGSGGARLSGGGTAFFRTADGSLEGTTMKMNTEMANPQGGQPMKLAQNIKVSRKK